MASSSQLLAMCLLITGYLSVCSGSNILMMSPFGTKSHGSFYGEIISILLERGHKVTLVNSYSMKSHANLTQINLDLRMEQFINNTFEMSDFRTMMKLSKEYSPRICAESLQREAIRQINVDDFDLAMTGLVTTECFLSLLDGKEIPRILFFPNNIASIGNSVTGNIGFPSFDTSMLSNKYHPMGFFGRLKNLLLNEILSIAINCFVSEWILSECKVQGLCRQDLSSFREIERKSSLFFINNVRALDVPARPFMPGIINAGGLNCKPAQPLPEDLESWVQEAGDEGFIYMSLGTAIKPSDMPEESRRILLEVFRSLPYRVLWKWNEDTIEGLPPNVKLAKWLPQQDILGHPKMKLFISHGGLFSTFEAIYHGVPVLGMPIFVDQFTNVDKIVTAGWGERTSWDELNANTLRKTIMDLTTDERYSNEVQRRSMLMRDQLVSPQDQIAYWTEYVIRHKGAPHMRSPVLDMYWYEVHNVDVWFFILTMFVGIVVLLLMLCGVILRCCCRRCRGKSATRKKEKRQ